MERALTSRDRAYLDLLHQGLVFLRNATRSGRMEFAPIESEHLHEVPSLIGQDGESQHLYYLRGTRSLYLDQLRALGDAEYLKQVTIWYSRPWRLLAEAAGWHLPAWNQEAAPGAAADG